MALYVRESKGRDSSGRVRYGGLQKVQRSRDRVVAERVAAARAQTQAGTTTANASYQRPEDIPGAVASTVTPEGQAGVIVMQPQPARPKTIGGIVARSSEVVASSKRSPNEFITTSGERIVPVASTRDDGFLARTVPTPVARAETTQERRARQSPTYAGVMAFGSARKQGATIGEAAREGVRVASTSKPIGARQDVTKGFFGPLYISERRREQISSLGRRITGERNSFGRTFIGTNIERFGTSPRRSALEFGAGGLLGRAYAGARGTGVALGGQSLARIGVGQRAGEFATRAAITSAETVVAVEGIRRSRGDVNVFGLGGFAAGASSKPFFGMTPITQGVRIRNPLDNLVRFRRSSVVDTTATFSRKPQTSRLLSTRLPDEQPVTGLPATFVLPRGVRRDVVGLPTPRAEFARRFGPSREPVVSDLSFVGGRGFVERPSGYVPARPSSSTFTSPIASGGRFGLNPETGLVEYEVGSGGQVLLMRQAVRSRRVGRARTITSETGVARRESLFSELSTTSGSRNLASVASGGLATSRFSGRSLGVSSRSSGRFFGGVGGFSGSRFVSPRSFTGFSSVGVSQTSLVSPSVSTGFRVSSVQSSTPVSVSSSSLRSISSSFASSVPRFRPPRIPSSGIPFPPLFGGGAGRSRRGTRRSSRRVDVYGASLTAGALGLRARRGERRPSGFRGFEVRGL